VAVAAQAGTSLADFSTLKMEAIRSYETSVHTRSTQRHISEEGILHSHRCENLKSYILILLFKEWHQMSQINSEIRKTGSLGQHPSVVTHKKK
jgi:hypothetical protein